MFTKNFKNGVGTTISCSAPTPSHFWIICLVCVYYEHPIKDSSKERGREHTYMYLYICMYVYMQATTNILN